MNPNKINRAGRGSLSPWPCVSESRDCRETTMTIGGELMVNSWYRLCFTCASSDSPTVEVLPPVDLGEWGD